MSAAPHAELESWRGEFPILQTSTYLNSCSLGALSRRSMGYLGEYQALWNTMGASAWYELWMGRLAELRGRVAELWSAQPEEVALMPSVSTALSSIASAVDYSKRNQGGGRGARLPHPDLSVAGEPGVEVVRVPSDDGISIRPERWAEYIDERTAVVATSHVFYSHRPHPGPRARRRGSADAQGRSSSSTATRRWVRSRWTRAHSARTSTWAGRSNGCSAGREWPFSG